MFKDIKVIRENDPAANSVLEIFLCYPGFHSLVFHRISHFLYRIGIPLIPRLLSNFSRFLTGVEIHPGAKIEYGVMIDHGSGVVIGETAEIGNGCLIYQGVTLGGTGKEHGKRHPTLKENVVVGAGAKVLGNITIGNNVRIGAGSVVMKNVPDNCTVVGIPGRIVGSNASKEMIMKHMLDHNELPDPVMRIVSILTEKIDTLQKQLIEVSRDCGKEHPRPGAKTTNKPGGSDENKTKDP